MCPVHIIKIINIWSSYGCSVPNQLHLRDQFLVYALFHSNTIGHSIGLSHNCSAELNWELRNFVTDSPTDFPFYRHINCRENSRTFMGNLILHCQPISLLNIPDGMRGAYRPGDTIPLHSSAMTLLPPEGCLSWAVPRYGDSLVRCSMIISP